MFKFLFGHIDLEQLRFVYNFSLEMKVNPENRV